VKHARKAIAVAPKMYIRNDDKAEMIEIAPSQAVNVPAALKLHLVTPETLEAARRVMVTA
jgi:hypothetical protein